MSLSRAKGVKQKEPTVVFIFSHRCGGRIFVTVVGVFPINNLKTTLNLNYVQGFISYRTVDTPTLSYEQKLANVVKCKILVLRTVKNNFTVSAVYISFFFF